MKRKDGGMTLVEMSCHALSLEFGEITRIKGVLRDVTFKVFYDDSPVGLFLINKNKEGKHIVSQVNETFARMHKFDNVADIYPVFRELFKRKTA